MILDLKDKLKELLTEERLKVPAGPRGLIEEATAPANLGYNWAVAGPSHVPLTEGPLEQVLRKALILRTRR
jgi:hypothetical protein